MDDRSWGFIGELGEGHQTEKERLLYSSAVGLRRRDSRLFERLTNNSCGPQCTSGIVHIYLR